MRPASRLLALTLGLALMGGGAVAAAPASQGNGALGACDDGLPPDLRAICERGILRVVRYDGERPPFFTRREGDWVGFDVDLGRDMARRLGVEYREIVDAASFDEVVDLVARGEGDIGLSKLSATLERAMRVRFSKAYLTVYQALLVNRLSVPSGGDPFAALDASSFTIGALAGTSYVPYAESSMPRARVTPYDDFGALMADVVSGRADAALMDSARADTWRRANQELLVHVRTTMDRSRRDPLAIAVGWRNTHLLAWVNLYLDQIRVDGTAERLYRKWFDASETAAAPGAEGDQ